MMCTLIISFLYNTNRITVEGNRNWSSHLQIVIILINSVSIAFQRKD